ncbi:hypothetical protein GQ53DRAFT_538536 [Thozetella sp. PMI_491]|nr:hypothetical protein GQ53DRAFT_538536 [Thozetella sp. PMI_491]
MTRPEIIRADSIDLQDREAPSAQEHPRSKPPTNGSTAPHQAETLREVAAETAEENLRSPRVSWANGGDVGDIHQYAEGLAAGVASSLNGQNTGARGTMATQQQDALAIAQNGGISVQEVDDGDLDGDADDGLDDDMMDKISSSPSIEDGGSTYTLSLPERDFSFVARPPCSSLAPPATGVSKTPSPCFERPEHNPFKYLDGDSSDFVRSPSCHHHLPGEYHEQDEATANDDDSMSSTRAISHEGTTLGAIRQQDDPILREVLDEMERLEQEWVRSDGPGRKTTLRDQEWIDYPDETAQAKAAAPPAEEHPVFDTDPELTVPYEPDEDDDGDFSELFSPRFLDSGWGGECLQDTEDIDFEFVYALHTFVATVEGQANATKGDTMVLLDDSNSYWWLVRVVKDSSIGYLPAEHIETPTERLARLNKHRNIDLSATMLGDQAEKSRNPLKSAMKRTKRKTVQFAGNTYVDYSDIDYSTEEEDLEAEYLAQQQQQQSQQQQAQQAQTASQQANGDGELEDESAKVEPLKPRSVQKEVKIEKQEVSTEADTAAKGPGRTSDEIFEVKSGDGPKKTSDGTVRDSFFNETVETKKITLTPNLLRDDTAPRSSGDSKDLKQRPSLDKLEKDNPLKDDKKKKDKKEKDKKPSAIRSFFSRKDKKTKGEDDDELLDKRSFDIDTSQDREVAEDEDLQASPEKASGVQRQPSKLQKQQPRTEPSPTRKPGGGQQGERGMDLVTFLSEGKVNNVANVPPATMRVVDSDLQESIEPQQQQQPLGPARDSSPEASRKDDKSTIAKILPSRSQSGDREPKPQKAVKAKSRVELDDFDSNEEDFAPEPQRPAPVPDERQRQQRPTLPGAYPDSYLSSQTGSSVQTERGAPVKTTPPQQHVERLSESPVQVSPANSNNPPPLMVDTSSQEEDHSSRSSPELIEHEDADMRGNKDSITTSTSATTTSTWNDANLRAFFDSGTDIRDLLVVVYDKTNVEPVGPEHPVAGTLFKEQNAKLAEITTQLDNMLGDWLARKQRLRSGL